MAIRYDSGSFRDPSGRVFYHDGEIYRELTPEGLPLIQELYERGVIEALVRDEKLVESHLHVVPPDSLSSVGVDKPVIWHKKVRWVTYPYEWPFSMLKSAALLTLDIVDQLAADALTLKDGTPFNVLFEGTQPLFIDLTSISSLDRPLWKAYGQFCQGFLFPLMLASHLRLPVSLGFTRPLSGLHVNEVRQLLGIRSIFRSGVFRHVLLQAFLEERFNKEDVLQVDNQVAEFPNSKVVRSTIANLHQTIDALGAPKRDSVWSHYSDNNSYSETALGEKREFVENWAKAKRFESVVDIGCNTGEYSKIVAKYASHVLAVDQDSQCVEQLYGDLRRCGIQNVHPIVVNLLEPSPGHGWGNSERRSFLERAEAEAFLALALLHHLSISGDIPLLNIAQELRGIAPCGIVEWVGPDDSMVLKMMAGRDKNFDLYTFEAFVDAFGRYFTIDQMLQTSNPHRKLIVLDRLT